MSAESTIIIVDDDPGIRESLEGLLRSVGLQVKALASVPEFVKEGRPRGPACLVLDVRLPGRSGLDFQRELSAANIHVPIIFITGYGDIPMSVRAIKGGAIEFLTKPFRDQDLLDAIQQGLARDSAWRENEKAAAALRARFEALTHHLQPLWLADIRAALVLRRGYRVTGRNDRGIAPVSPRSGFELQVDGSIEAHSLARMTGRARGQKTLLFLTQKLNFSGPGSPRQSDCGGRLTPTTAT